MKRTTKILRFLIQSNRFVRVDELSDIFEIAERTVRNDLILIERLLNEHEIVFERDRVKGFYVDASKIKEGELYKIIHSDEEKDGYYLSSGRTKIIYETILLRENKITLDYLCETTKTSKSTVIESLGEIERLFKKRNIELEKRPRFGMQIRYEESDWRKAALEHMITNLDYVDVQGWVDSDYSALLVYDPIVNQFINRFISGIDAQQISMFVQKYETDFNICFYNNTFVIALLYICLSLSRMVHGHELKNTDKILGADISEEYLEWVFANKEFLQKSIGQDIPKIEMKGIITYLANDLQNFIKDEEVNKLDINEEEISEKFIIDVGELLDVDYKKHDSVYNHLKLHVVPCFRRIIYNIENINPLKKEVKLLYPDLYKTCHAALGTLEKLLDESISDEELSLLTMYIGDATEKIRKEVFSNYFYRVLVIGTDDSKTNDLLCYRLLNEFINFMIDDVITSSQLSSHKLKHADIIITVVPAFIATEVPVIKVSPILSGEDIIKIKSKLNKKHKKCD